jgi:ribosomal-protein-alanine N-acetyltransferase
VRAALGVRLRPLRAEDLDALHAIFSDPRAMRYWDRPAWSDIAETERLLAGFMREAPQEHLERGIVLGDHLIGRVGMWRRHEIGYILYPDHWGAGHATAVLQAFLPEVFHRFPEVDALTAEIDPRNIASARLLVRLGFTCDRVEEKNFLYGGSEWCDTAYYRLNRPQLPAGTNR